MRKKQVIRCVAFLLTAGLMLLVLCDLFEQENGGNTDRTYSRYRETGEGTIDAVFIGTSGVAVYWVSPLAYEEYGMTVYNLAADAMPAFLYPNVIDEVLTYQDPELIMLDIRPFTSGYVPYDKIDASARFVLDAMDMLSLNRHKTALNIMNSFHTVYEEAPAFDISYFLSVVKYHDKWSSSEYRVSYNLGQRTHPYFGFRLDDEFSAVVSPQIPTVYDPAVIHDLGEWNEQLLYSLLDYIREKELNVLFVDTPKVIGGSMGVCNRVYQILEEEGFDYLTHLAPPEDGSFPLEIDYQTDFCNGGHVNYYGAEKFTRALAAYLDIHYDLPDRRNDPSVQAEWDGVYDRLQEELEWIEAETARRGNTGRTDALPEG